MTPLSPSCALVPALAFPICQQRVNSGNPGPLTLDLNKHRSPGLHFCSLPMTPGVALGHAGHRPGLVSKLLLFQVPLTVVAEVCLAFPIRSTRANLATTLVSIQKMPVRTRLWAVSTRMSVPGTPSPVNRLRGHNTEREAGEEVQNNTPCYQPGEATTVWSRGLAEWLDAPAAASPMSCRTHARHRVLPLVRTSITTCYRVP